MDNCLFEMEIKDSDYDDVFGEFVYKYLDILLQDKLPEGEEKNIARILIDYQQFFETKMYDSLWSLYRQIIYLCTDPELQNISMIYEVKNNLYNFTKYFSDFYKNMVNISAEYQQSIWYDKKSYIDKNNILPDKIPEELLIKNIIKEYHDALEFISSYIVDKNINIFEI